MHSQWPYMGLIARNFKLVAQKQHKVLDQSAHACILISPYVICSQELNIQHTNSYNSG